MNLETQKEKDKMQEIETNTPKERVINLTEAFENLVTVAALLASIGAVMFTALILGA